MKRETKEQILNRVQDVKAGKEEVVSFSPRQMRTYGQHLPAEIAIPMILKGKRGRELGKPKSREIFDNERTLRGPKVNREITKR